MKRHQDMLEELTYCGRCGTKLVQASADEPWPRKCNTCGNLKWHNPTGIGALIQPVVGEHEGQTRIGVATPIRGQDPMAGHPALIGGYTEATDTSSENSAARERTEEVQLPMIDEDDIEAFVSRACGPLRPLGKRQMLHFSIAPVIPVTAFDGFVPDRETLAIEFSWSARVLAFPTHTFAMARFFKLRQGHDVPEHYLVQPRTAGLVLVGGSQVEIYDVPYAQPLLDQGIWSVLLEMGGEPVAIVNDRGVWRAA